MKISTADGIRLGVSKFEPPHPIGRTIVINSATGIERRFYTDFAEYLTARGFVVWTYDYRGVGETEWPGDPFASRMHHWGEFDQAAVLQEAFRADPDNRLCVVGHSVGGQILGLTPLSSRVAGLLGVGAQSGYWGHWEGFRKLGFALFWYGILPVATVLARRYPGRLLGGPFDLPAGVALEWARWCRAPGFILEVHRESARAPFMNYSGRVRLYAFTDDPLAPPRAVRALTSLYPSSDAEILEVAPGQIGSHRIGHLGFFRSSHSDPLWHQAADWLSSA